MTGAVRNRIFIARLRAGTAAGTLGAAALAALTATPAQAVQAQSQGEVRGVVSDQRGEAFFAGAEVTIVELGRSDVTDQGGRYSFANVPAGEYTLRARYFGADPVEARVTVAPGGVAEQPLRIGADVEAIDNILVVGQRSNLSSALNRKRNADNILSAVDSDFIGQFPDQNVTEAAQRIPGVSINRDQGEGRFITIRGANPNLNSTSINGIRVTTADNSERSVALDVIPSEILETLEVAKTLTPDMDGDAIGGAVNIESATAFDREGFSATLSAEGSYNELRDEVSPRLNASASDIFDLSGGGKFGVSGALSYFDRKLGSDNVENGDGVDDVNGVTFPAVIEPRDYVLARTRFGGSLNLDWRVNPDWDLYVRTLYSDFADDEIQGGTIFEADPDDGANVITAEGSQTLFANQEVESYVSDRKETQTIFTVAAGGENRAGPLTSEYVIGYSDAGEDNPNYVETIFVADFSDTGVGVGTDLSDPRRPQIVTDNSGAFNDASAYELDEVIFEDSETSDTEWSAKLDLQYDMNFGRHPGFLKFGAKGSQREKTGELDAMVYGGADQGLTVADFLNPDIDYPLGRIAPQADPKAVAQHVRSNLGVFMEDLDEEGSFIDSNVEDYVTNEDIYAGYGMAQVDIDALRLVGGVRVEHTNYDSEGNEISLNEETEELTLTPLVAEDEYTDILPSLNARYAFSDALFLRAAYFRSVVRPIFEQNRPAGIIETDDEGVIEAEAGNPDLERLKADNFDVSLEYYPGDIGLISGGVFFKSIQNPAFAVDVAGTPGFEGFDQYATFINGDDAEVYGFEIAYQRALDFLPAPLDGFLVAANYTRVETDAATPIPGETGSRDVPLPFQSENVANASLGYDKGDFQARFSVAYRDRYLAEIGDASDPEEDIYIDEHIQLDLTGSYQITDTFQVFGQVSNINDRPLYSYAGDESVNVQYEEYGFTAALGVKAIF